MWLVLCAGGPGGQAGQPGGQAGQPGTGAGQPGAQTPQPGGEAGPAASTPGPQGEENCRKVPPEDISIVPGDEPKLVIEGLPEDQPATLTIKPKEEGDLPGVKVIGKSNPEESPADEPTPTVRSPCSKVSLGGF